MAERVEFESACCMEIREFCDAAWPSKELKGMGEFLVPPKCPRKLLGADRQVDWPHTATLVCLLVAFHRNGALAMRTLEKNRRRTCSNALA